LPKVTVYMPCFNYADYAEAAVKSVLAQTMEDWELIIIDDGSTDNSLQVLRPFDDHQKIRVIEQENKGLNVTNNIALRLARGQYVMRLDADDWLDENALLVLSNTLDKREDAGLVYPDYYEVDTAGNISQLIRREKVGEEDVLLDLPAHGACTMFRREVMMQLGGYVEDYSCQDGYELWLRFIRHFKPYNVNVPLFYYRKHGSSLSDKQDKILQTRRQIKRDFVERELGGRSLSVLGLIPVAFRSPYPNADPFQDLGGKPLIAHTIDQALEAKSLNTIAVSTRRPDVLEFLQDYPEIIALERPENLMPSGTGTERAAAHALSSLKESTGEAFDAVCSLYISTPFREAHHIDWAIDTMEIFDVDTVLSVQEELAPCYKHDETGIHPINKIDGVRVERDAIFKENGAIFLSKAHVIEGGKFIGNSVGHVTMLPEESIKINSEYEFWLAERVMEKKMTAGR
jgi:CMP-N-acetylneuraminic acid synthetase